MCLGGAARQVGAGAGDDLITEGVDGGATALLATYGRGGAKYAVRPAAGFTTGGAGATTAPRARLGPGGSATCGAGLLGGFGGACAITAGAGAGAGGAKKAADSWRAAEPGAALGET